MQLPSSPSSVQQQFAFAAGLAAAEELPLSTPDPAETTQLQQLNTLTEPEELPARQQQFQDDESAKQSTTQPEPRSGVASSNDRQLDGQTDGQTDRQTLTPTGSDVQTDGQASVPKGQPSGKSIQQDEQPDTAQDPDQQRELIYQRDDWSQPDQHVRGEAQQNMGPATSAESMGSSGTGSSNNSNNAGGDDISSAEAEVVEIEQMSFGERLQAGIDCFR